MKIFNNLSVVKKGGMELLFYTISYLILLDLFSLQYYGVRIESLKEIPLTQFALSGAFYIILFHLAKFFRRLILFICLHFNFFQNTTRSDSNEYYYLNELLNEALHEDNATKLAVYHGIKTKRKRENNIYDLFFMILLLMIVSIPYSESIIRILSSYKGIALFLILFVMLFLNLVFRDDRLDERTSLRKKEKNVV